MIHHSEIERLTKRLEEALLRPNPTQGTLDQIRHYEEMLAHHKLALSQQFTPYRDDGGRLVINDLGDTEEDL
ncbi:hypothetical protein [Shinella sp. JR1-6]|uniref:hypothetical protein n=1 Tax=Shinella sp. JR1-6 TaxID=2527671 RepID=UPI00102D64E7|nr:hypothetical protein [Shinella sp. JR1-6]TAA61883.1 hypothetical protein EXZ48_12240 [Shinella sp. JR1-6]